MRTDRDRKWEEWIKLVLTHRPLYVFQILSSELHLLIEIMHNTIKSKKASVCFKQAAFHAGQSVSNTNIHTQRQTSQSLTPWIIQSSAELEQSHCRSVFFSVINRKTKVAVCEDWSQAANHFLTWDFWIGEKISVITWGGFCALSDDLT